MKFTIEFVGKRDGFYPTLDTRGFEREMIEDVRAVLRNAVLRGDLIGSDNDWAIQGNTITTPIVLAAK